MKSRPWCDLVSFYIEHTYSSDSYTASEWSEVKVITHFAIPIVIVQHYANNTADLQIVTASSPP